MNSTASVFIATSLDGFIARKDGNLDWLDKASALAPKDEDCGYKAFMGEIDALVMGKNTFDKVLSFGVPWPYAKPVFVLSSKQFAIPNELENKVTWMTGSPAEIMLSLAKRGLQRIYVDGGITIQRFLAAGLIDNMTINIAPVILGEGIPLFGVLPKDISLSLIHSRSYDFGFVQLCYKINREHSS